MAAPAFSEWIGQQGTTPATAPSFADFVGGKTAGQTPPSFADYIAGAQPPAAASTPGPVGQSLRPMLSAFGPNTDSIDAPQSPLGEGATPTPQPEGQPEFRLSPEEQRLVDEGYMTLSEPTYSEGYAQGEGATWVNPQWNYTLTPTSKAPATRYGSDPTQIRPYDVPSGRGGGALRDPNLWYDDPNYGPITPRSNTIDPSSERDIYDMLGPAAMSIVLGAAGMGLMGPVAAGQGTAVGLAQGAAGALRSGGASIPSFIGSTVGSLTGIPGASTAGAFLGSSLAGNNPNPINSLPGAALNFVDWLVKGAK